VINWKNRVADLELQLSQQKEEIHAEEGRDAEAKEMVDYLERELGAARRGNEELQTQLSMASDKSRGKSLGRTVPLFSAELSLFCVF
jgi:predicted RNase H-like nuclease (RuvC/YqgF family)